ncbi:MAG: polymer-forming cytoskeletal protein [Azonexus sp.]|nr:polymer-forming cytoskeletal protein [Azonexus sp.]MDZ4313440.1 polymer-forming cytoskeletal protein [Azonexus sp.]
MFSKSSLSNRNEPITRKDVRSVFGGTSTAADVTSTELAPDHKTPAINPPVATEATQTAPTGDKTIGSQLIVGSDVKLKGAEILDCDTLVVEGRVEATMDSRVIRIAEKGAFIGKVSIDIAEIHGSFEGELTARSQLIIHATGRVSGKIRYGKLVIDEGGELCGDINALSSEKPSLPRPISELPPSLNIIAG